MALVLTEEQELLKDTASEFVLENSPVARLRKLRDTADSTGFSRSLWKEMAELGWMGLHVDESLGGQGFGLAELSIVVEELGYAMAASYTHLTLPTNSDALPPRAPFLSHQK